MDIVEIVNTSGFFVLGYLTFIASRKWGLKDYEKPRLTWVDGVLVVWLLFVSAMIFKYTYVHLDSLFISLGVGNITSWVLGWPLAIRIVIALLVADLVIYWGHRLMHTHWLWPIHAFHHSARNLNWFTGLRETPIHNFIIMAGGYFGGFAMGVYNSVTGIIATVIIGYFVQFWIHSTIDCPFTRKLEYVFITPRFHLLHHHPRPGITNTNYAFIFTFWDRIFGTYTDPDKVKEEDRGQLGLDYEIGFASFFLGVELEKRRPRKNYRPLPVDKQTSRARDR